MSKPPSIRDGTPWELHEGIWVKREDLSCPNPGPAFSKVRGVYKWLLDLRNKFIPPKCIGVLDTRHSKAGWGVTYLARHLGIPVKLFYPVFKDDVEGQYRESQERAMALGAELCPLRGNLMSAVLWNIAKKEVEKAGGVMAPNGLKFKYSVDGTCIEVLRNWNFCRGKPGTLVVSASSATLASGVALGLSKLKDPSIHLVVHMGYSRSLTKVRSYMESMGVPSDMIARIEFIDEGYRYADSVETPCPFPCNPYYDRKAWKWIVDNKMELSKRGWVGLWNIGA